ncbi:GerW family sporulation protein [Paenibacillus thermotolerans]|uniref:GerW family sporulation protein n=1 Tax=Paenibacillus thermotolerans TaxID=3027807 RepID=UPI002367DAA6|nr:MULTISPECIES: GerW family sporulation protein [unclassified Paenibacillus]
MSEHPIQGLMRTAMENIRQMVDVNTIVGDPVNCPDGTVILPISKAAFGFAAGGSEFAQDRIDEEQRDRETHAIAPFESRHGASVAMPFGGGSGGGISITPIAFLVVGQHGVKVVPLDNQTRMFERLIESAPQMVEKLQSMFGGKKETDTRFNDVTYGAPMEGIPTESNTTTTTTL